MSAGPATSEGVPSERIHGCEQQSVHICSGTSASLLSIQVDGALSTVWSNLGGFDHFYSINMIANIVVSKKNFEIAQIVQEYSHTF